MDGEAESSYENLMKSPQNILFDGTFSRLITQPRSPQLLGPSALPSFPSRTPMASWPCASKDPSAPTASAATSSSKSCRRTAALRCDVVIKPFCHVAVALAERADASQKIVADGRRRNRLDYFSVDLFLFRASFSSTQI